MLSNCSPASYIHTWKRTKDCSLKTPPGWFNKQKTQTKQQPSHEFTLPHGSCTQMLQCRNGSSRSPRSECSAGVPLWRQVFRLLHDIPSSLHKPHAYKQLELIHCHFLLLSPHIIKANFSQEFNWRQKTSLPAVLSPQHKLWVSIGSIEIKYEERTCPITSLCLAPLLLFSCIWKALSHYVLSIPCRLILPLRYTDNHTWVYMKGERWWAPDSPLWVLNETWVTA